VDVAKGSPLDRLLAEAEIRRVLGRYCRAVDRMDEALLRSCYHPGAIDSHGNFEGDVDEFVPWCLGMVARYTVTMHFLGTILIDPTDDPDVVMSEAYAVALHRRDGGQPHHNLTAGFRYLDRFERRPVDGGDEAWRIGARVAVSEWLVKDPEAGWWPVGDSFLQGRRDREDASYRVSRTPGTPPLPR
jgi:hypothetical protein